MAHIHSSSTQESDIINYRGKQWTRRALGAFLNLVVLPGAGSFVLGRKVEGTAQVLLVAAGLGLKLAGVAAISQRIGSEVGQSRYTHGAQDPWLAAAQIAEAIKDVPPSVVGISSLWLVGGGLALFVAAWLFSLVSSLLPPKGRPWT